jgi:ribosomal protein L11 methyltransferase
LADPRVWPALIVRGPHAAADLLAAALDDCSPAAIEDLVALPLPPGGLWDPTCPPPPEPPPGPVHWRVFFATAELRDQAARTISHQLPDVVLTEEDVADEDWAARSQRSLTAVEAGAFIVAPPWDLPPLAQPGHTIIVIEPSRGFGTGHHASTRLCLRALSTIDVAGRRVIDLGTGSGVLAIAASLGGAAHVLAVDVDPDAIESAQHSALLNPRAGDIEWVIGDYRDPGWVEAHGGPWPIVLANLTGGMLMTSAQRLRELLAPGGVLTASGFDESEREGVEQALGLDTRSALAEEGWVGLVLSSGC